MSDIPSELKYSKEHEWVRIDDDGKAVVGITDHAQLALGDVVFRSLQRDEFDRVVEHFSAHLANGQRSSYLGAFRIHGMTVHYWRLRFSDQPDDWLAKLAVKDEQVRGFFISPP